jgi:2-polyprenyl-3-methyl-5-hydroxy-6-metoxy-1,4-benzoquinol methylase
MSPMASTAHSSEPNPAIVWDTIHAFQRTACLRGAVELDLFTKIGEGNQTVGALARACNASERGIRILCDFLTVNGLLTKNDGAYALTVDSATFLDRRSPACFGGALKFLCSPEVLSGFENMAEVVRKGTTQMPGSGTVDPDDPVWVDFARSMPPMVAGGAPFIAQHAAIEGPQRVLDIAAGHGMFGIAIAQRNPQAVISPVDWTKVLEVARENAQKAGVADRYQPITGDAFQVDFGTGYDTVLLTNFLHHFDPPTNEGLLRKVRASLKPGGKVFTLEFVPNPDRVTPPVPAAFAIVMLAGTPSGNAYTFDELSAMFQNAGFASTERIDMPKSPETLLVSR